MTTQEYLIEIDRLNDIIREAEEDVELLEDLIKDRWQRVNPNAKRHEYGWCMVSADGKTVTIGVKQDDFDGGWRLKDQEVYPLELFESADEEQLESLK